MREVLGITHPDLNPHTRRGENWGYLVRETTPFPWRSGERTLIPGFALYGRDLFAPEKPPLIWDLVGDGDPLAFVLESIMFPIIRHWVTGFRKFGFILEPHGQNALLEADAVGRIHRVVHRDLNVGIDMGRRRDANLPEGEMNDYNRMETGHFSSIAFDRFMGGHFFDQLVTTIRDRRPDLQSEDFRDPCRRLFAEIFPDHERYLPRREVYFSEKRDAFGKPLFQDTGLEPRWRP